MSLCLVRCVYVVSADHAADKRFNEFQYKDIGNIAAARLDELSLRTAFSIGNQHGLTNAMKRYSELIEKEHNRASAPSRGYINGDNDPVSTTTCNGHVIGDSGQGTAPSAGDAVNGALTRNIIAPNVWPWLRPMPID